MITAELVGVAKLPVRMLYGGDRMVDFREYDICFDCAIRLTDLLTAMRDGKTAAKENG